MDSSALKAELIVSVLFVFYHHLVVEKTNSTHYRLHGSANSQIENKKQYMSQETQIQFFENAKIRVVWDEEKEEYFFSVVDVISVLTVSADAAAYWRKLKQRLKAEGNETVTSCHTLKMSASDGKMRLTDVATVEQLFRLIQSVPSKKAEPFRLPPRQMNCRWVI